MLIVSSILAATLLSLTIAKADTGQAKTSKYPWINTWAIEYYEATGSTLQKDAEYFDLHLSPHDVTGLKSFSPGSIAVFYNIWREQYANEDPGAVLERKKIDAWCAANGKNKENFYCHYRQDITIKCPNLLTGQDEYKLIPGWDPANDTNNDGVRDWASDYGNSTSAGAGYLGDTSKAWTANRWANATLIDKNGNKFTIASNTSNRLTLTSGTPAAGRYGISAAGSPNPLATAKNRSEARVQMFIWQAYAYAMNIGNVDYQNYRAYDGRKVMIEGDTSWDPDANVLWDGYMVDNTQPEFPWAEVVDGTESVVEYPNKSDWQADQVDLFAAVRSAISPKYIWGNTGNYDYPEIAQAGGGQHQEMEVAVVNEHGPTQWDYWKQLSDKGLYDMYLPSWDCWTDQSDRERMHYLAFHYMGQQPYIYLGFRGFGYRETLGWDATPYDWFPAAGVDVGTAIDAMYVKAVSGTDPAKQAYSIYTRRYTKALIVCRPKLSWSDENYGSGSAVTYNLPSYTATSGGESNSYKPLLVNGTLGTAVTKVTLRNPESFILFPADGTTPGGEGGGGETGGGSGDTTGPQVSGISLDGIRFDVADISWTTDEAATCVVQYGPTTSYGSQIAALDNSTDHSLALKWLSGSTTYHYRVLSTDSAGNTSTSGDYVLTTPAEPVGFVKNWLAIGPFADSGGSGFDEDYLGGESAVKPSVGTTTGACSWKQWSSETDFINLGQALGLADNQVGYACVYINSPNAKAVTLKLGSDDGVKVWLNGSIIHSNNVGRGATPDDDTVSMNLVQGWNRLLIKVTNQEGDWGFYARLVDSSDAAVSDLQFALDTPSVPTDTTSPVISSVKATQATTSQVNITWTTDEPGSSAVEYGATSSYGKTASATESATSHSVALTGLSTGVVYHYRVKSSDAEGNTTTSGDYTFTIPSPAATYLRNWLLIGTFDDTSRKGFYNNYIGETTVAPSAGLITAGKTWKSYQSGTDRVDLKSQFTSSNYRLAYAHVYVYSPIQVSCQLRVGSDDGIKIWLNGSVIFSKLAQRTATPDSDKIGITLQPGWNRILLKVDNVDSGWGFYARITDSLGKQIPGLQSRLNKPATR